MAFPQIAGYTLAIQQNGVKAFKTLSVQFFVPAKTKPIKVYAYSSGMFAVIFKVQINNNFHAVRCFLTAKEMIEQRYRYISDYLYKIPAQDWMVPFRFINDEFLAESRYQPIVVMDWIDGQPINQYVTRNITNTAALTALQEKIYAVSESLTNNRIGHGDLQAGNILIDHRDGNIRLIDYDNMYVPALQGQRSIELGRPEYQHPRRHPGEYNEKTDWFSIWVMLTALEAVKEDPSLWNLVNQKGYNTLGNFLFSGEDFLHPQHSPLFKQLLNMDAAGVKYYVDKLLSFCGGAPSNVERPRLFAEKAVVKPAATDSEVFCIDSSSPAIVLSQRLQKIATTPCELDRKVYTGKKLIISSGNRTKLVELVSGQTTYFIEFN